MIINSLNHYIMMVVKWLDNTSQHTREIFTNICAGYYQFFLTKSRGKYFFSTILRLSIYHQIQWITGVGVEIMKSFTIWAHFLTRKGFQYKFHVWDNYSREALKIKITDIGYIYQLIPLVLIWENNTEQEIKTLYAHFWLGLWIYDTKYTLRLRYLVLPQGKTTLNMLCPWCPHQQLLNQLHIAW